MGRAHFQPPLQQVSGRNGLHLTSHTHEAEGKINCQGGSASPRLSRYPRVSRNIPPRRNKRTTIWQEVIHDTAGLKIDPVLTDRAVFHDLCIVLLVYTLTSCGWDSAQDLKTNNKDRLLFFFFCTTYRCRNRIVLASIRILCGLELENRENQTFSRMSKQRTSCLGGFKGSHGMWSINDLPEKTEKSTFSGGGYFFCFDVTAHGILHRGSSKHYIMQEKSMRGAVSFSNCGLLHINQSSVRKERN